MASVTRERIEEFLTVISGSGDGCGSVDGCGSGYGSGDGSGYGCGSGDGCGSGYGSGYGYGSGDGSGSGYGSGYGSVDGCGSGSGDGYGVSRINGDMVYYVDGLQTIFRAIRGSTARGALLRDDLSLVPCFIAKLGAHFAHGETLKEAVEAVREKYFDDMPVEEKIAAFLKEVKLDRKYPASEFYEWHHRLTGSCEMGRKEFMRSRGIEMDDEYTVAEFIEIVKNDFGGEVIRKLKETTNEKQNH